MRLRCHRNRWSGTASPEDALRALSQVRRLGADEVPGIPRGRPFPLERFAEAAPLAEAPAHGTEPFFVLEDGQDGRRRA